MRVNRQTTDTPGKNEPLRLGLSKRAIEALGPGSKRYLVHDERCAGLAVCVFESGTKSFLLYKKINGRPQKVTLGRFPAMTLEQARRRVAELQAEVAKGENPGEKKRRHRQGKTLGELWERFEREHVDPHCRPSTAKGYKWQWEKHLVHWKNRRVSDLTEDDIQTWHLRLGKESPYMANRALALLSVILSHKNKNGPNPCRDVERFAETSRDRYLQPDEMGPFLDAVDADENEVFADCVRLMLFTGCRQSNICEMRWEDVNLDSRTWRIPRTKNNEPLHVPLTEAAMAVLRRRKASAGDCPWVLPGKSPSGHTTRPKASWDRLLKRAGIKNLRMHDLRRSFGSWQAAGGTSLFLIGKSLGHRTSQATAIYSHVNLDPIRASVEAATQAMLAAAKVKPGPEGGEE